MTEWCCRTLVASPYYFRLCLTEKDFHRELKRLELPRGEWPNYIHGEHSHATTHFLHSCRGQHLVIVCMRDWETRNGVEIAGLLVHEATHIWQESMRNIGETSPSDEFMAYGIQNLSQELMDAFVRQTGSGISPK